MENELTQIPCKKAQKNVAFLVLVVNSRIGMNGLLCPKAPQAIDPPKVASPTTIGARTCALDQEYWDPAHISPINNVLADKVKSSPPIQSIFCSFSTVDMGGREIAIRTKKPQITSPTTHNGKLI